MQTYLLLGTHTRGLRVRQPLRLRLALCERGVLGGACRLVRGTQLGLLRDGRMGWVTMGTAPKNTRRVKRTKSMGKCSVNVGPIAQAPIKI